MAFTELSKSIALVVSDNGIALVISLATIMSLIQLRSTHLSNVARDVASQYLKLKSEKRIPCELSNCLEIQMHRFYKRYESISNAFVCLAISFICLIPAILLSSSESKEYNALGIIICLFSLIFLLIGLFLSAKEFLNGKRTLADHLNAVTGKNKIGI